MRNIEEILDLTKTQGDAGKTVPVSLIGASNEKDTARRPGVMEKQWEEGCDMTRKGVTRSDKEKTDGLK